MDAIKKKMQGIKIAKDNAVDRADAAEIQLRDANLRVDKAKEEMGILSKKFQQIKHELNTSQTELTKTNETLDLKEKALHAVRCHRFSSLFLFGLFVFELF